MANQATCCPATIDIGPWGGAGGDAWDFMPCTNITGIQINHGNVVDSVSFNRTDPETGETVNLAKYGGTGGPNIDQVSIDGSEEYLTKISGTTTTDHVQSLTFYTNKGGRQGPFGSTTGSGFEIPLKNGKVVGFFGRAENYINAIGIHVIPHAH